MKMILFLLALLASHAALAENRLLAIHLHPRADGTTLELQLQAPVDPALVQNFLLIEPPQLVLDLPRSTAAATLARSLSGSGLVKRIQLAEDDDRLRLQVLLKHAAIYQLRAEEDRLLVDLTLQPPSDPVALQAIDLRRGPKGEAHLAVDMGSHAHTVQVRQLGGRLVVDIAGATVPLALRRLVETGQMGTPVLQYRAYGHQDGARLVLEMQGQWRYQAYQSKRRLMIDVVPVKSALTGIAAAGLQEGKTYGGPRLSLNFQNIEVRTALQVLAEHSGVNIVASDTVTGQLSLRLKDLLLNCI